MKKLVASRKLKRTCLLCNRSFRKGEVYYKQRTVFEEEGIIFAFESLICPRCLYKGKERDKRFKEFKKRCVHPAKFVVTEYRYIHGECIQEPDYDYCSLCGKHLGV